MLTPNGAEVEDAVVDQRLRKGTPKVAGGKRPVLVKEKSNMAKREVIPRYQMEGKACGW